MAEGPKLRVVPSNSPLGQEDTVLKFPTLGAAAFAVVRENEPDEPDEPDEPAHACSEHARVLKLLPIEQA